MLPRKSIIVLVALSTALTCLLLQQRNLTTTQNAVAEAQKRNQVLQERIAAASANRDALRKELGKQRVTLAEKKSAIAKAEKELAQVAPDARWVNPPENGPQWEDASPYVWVSKGMLPKLPGSPFTDKAELQDEVAATLAVDAPTKQALNEKLNSLVTQYRALEMANAERIEAPLPGIERDGPHVTVLVKPFPEEGERLERQFKDALSEALGQQRAGLILEGAAGWLDSQFGASGTEPRTISVVRHSDGSYNLSMQTGNSWFSTGGFKHLSDYVPDHLLPLFSEELETPAPSQGP